MTRCFTTEPVSCEPVWDVSGGEWRVREPGRPIPGSLSIPRSSPPFSAHGNIVRSFPGVPAVRRWPACTPNASRSCSYNPWHLLSTSTSRHPTRRAMAVRLDRQIFYVPPVVAGPKPASRGPRVQEEGPSTAIFGVPLPPSLLQNTHDPRPGGAGGSQDDAILIPSDDEFDDLDGRSDTSFGSLDWLRPTTTGTYPDLTFLSRPIC
jgi:hypothetical protein